MTRRNLRFLALNRHGRLPYALTAFLVIGACSSSSGRSADADDCDDADGHECEDFDTRTEDTGVADAAPVDSGDPDTIDPTDPDTIDPDTIDPTDPDTGDSDAHDADADETDACTTDCGVVCTPGDDHECAAELVTNECQAAVCDEASSRCRVVSVNEGAACETSDPDETARCVEGACVPVDCVCAGVGMCCDGCLALNTGGPCEDGDLCTEGDTCDAGICRPGPALDCGDDTECRQAGTCDSTTGLCTSTSESDGTTCTVASGEGACVDGSCTVEACDDGFADCNGDADDGCESPLDTSVEHCGVCGVSCVGDAFDGVCDEGVCQLRDSTPWVYCEAPRPGVRPVNLTNDAENCGACGEECGAMSTCEDGVCTLVPLAFVSIPAGTFMMGSPEDELGRGTFEELHEVTITRPFLLQITEVTRGQWLPYMTPNSEPDANPNQPIDEINWWDALLFANAYSHAMGLPPCYLVSGCGFPSDSQFRCDDVQINHPSNNPLNCEGFRLPTDAEWEYAYRAGTTTAFYNGPITELFNAPVDPTLDEIAWYAGNRDGDLQTVARKLPNAWGLYDMAGNVLEWCWDGLRFYDGATTDPLGPQEDVWRILRGGNIYNAPPRARAAWRGDNPFTARGVGVGFRLARTCASEDCDVPLCPPGFADCNGDPADGCETRLNNNSASCGACDTACDAPHHADVCLQGVCLLRPDTSWKLCTRRLMWGLEAVNTATDPAHCGACDAPCAPLETCEEGICVSVP